LNTLSLLEDILAVLNNFKARFQQMQESKIMT
jgi:hypothetical protein